jgi:hypothetical protein
VFTSLFNWGYISLPLKGGDIPVNSNTRRTPNGLFQQMAGNPLKKKDTKIRNFLAKARSPEFWEKFWEEVAASESRGKYRDVLDKHKIPYSYFDEYVAKFPAVKEAETKALHKRDARRSAHTLSRITEKQSQSVEERLDRGEIVDFREVKVTADINRDTARMLDPQRYGEKQQVNVTNLSFEFLKALKEANAEQSPKIVNPGQELTSGNDHDDSPGRRRDHDFLDDFRIDQQ